jgi:hypothetical protein
VKFDWLEAIKNSLLKKEKKEIKVKRLKKKVIEFIFYNLRIILKNTFF